MKHFTQLIAAIILVFAFSCDRPECKNTNPVFDANLPGSKAYNDELVRQIEMRTPDVEYWFERYEEKEGMEYIHVYIQGDSLCAKGIMTLINPDESMDNLRKVKGMSYGGAELKGLTFTIYRDNDRTELVYSGVDAIID